MEFIDNKSAAGNFFDLLDAGIEFCFKYLNLSGKIVGLRREEHLDIPFEALREALTNALCHRRYDDLSATVSLGIYDDRVEITNPGCFTHGLTPANIKQSHDSFPYNHTIAQVLFLSTYLENWGTGVNRMVDLCRKQGLPEPEYQSDGYTVKIIFWKSAQKTNDGNGTESAPVNINKTQTAIVNAVKSNNSITYDELSRLIGVNRATIMRNIVELKKFGLLERIGSDKTGYWKVIEKQ